MRLINHHQLQNLDFLIKYKLFKLQDICTVNSVVLFLGVAKQWCKMSVHPQ